MKLPWTSAREAEAQIWAERFFGEAPPACATRVGQVLAKCVTDDLEQLSPHRPFAQHEEFTELRRVELFVAIEREFGVSISEKEAELMTTPAAVVAFVSNADPRVKNGN